MLLGIRWHDLDEEHERIGMDQGEGTENEI